MYFKTILEMAVASLNLLCCNAKGLTQSTGTIFVQCFTKITVNLPITFIRRGWGGGSEKKDVSAALKY